jgi:hypothetical protein
MLTERHLTEEQRRSLYILLAALLRKCTPLCQNTSHHAANDQDRRVPFQPTEEQSQGNAQSKPAESALVPKPEQELATTLEACLTSFAVRFQYRGMERTAELPLTPHTMGQLALEAALRDVEIVELIAELITKIVNNDLFPLVLDNIDLGQSEVAAEMMQDRERSRAPAPQQPGEAPGHVVAWAAV